MQLLQWSCDTSRKSGWSWKPTADRRQIMYMVCRCWGEGEGEEGRGGEGTGGEARGVEGRVREGKAMLPQ